MFVSSPTIQTLKELVNWQVSQIVRPHLLVWATIEQFLPTWVTFRVSEAIKAIGCNQGRYSLFIDGTSVLCHSILHMWLFMIGYPTKTKLWLNFRDNFT
jgi:hypothetical protein